MIEGINKVRTQKGKRNVQEEEDTELKMEDLCCEIDAELKIS